MSSRSWLDSVSLRRRRRWRKPTRSETPWGDPDLGGVWDFSTITPLERPAELGDKEFLTPEEAAQANQAVVDRDAQLLARERENTTAGGSIDFREDGSPGFYNNFWLDAGSTTLSSLRTSQITVPKNGRLPEMTPSAEKRAADYRAYHRRAPGRFVGRPQYLRSLHPGIQRRPPDLTRVLQPEPPDLPDASDHVALLTEMVHTVRVVHARRPTRRWRMASVSGRVIPVDTGRATRSWSRRPTSTGRASRSSRGTT